MTKWVFVGVIVVGSVAAFVAFQKCRVEAWQRCYRQVGTGMTLDNVRELMDRDEDVSENLTTAAGEFERSWTFEENGVRITVVFDRNGRSTYKEFGPSFCGVTPLGEKLVRE